MMSQYERERIENWVGDFCASDRLREAPAATHEHAASVLAAFMMAACEHRNVEAGEIEEDDVRHALLNHAARLNVPGEAREHLPALCGVFLASLQDEGRLGGGRVLGAFARALQGAYMEAVSGKKKPVVRAGSKIGRNDPCPCGSGRKYKACCMNG